MRRFSPVLSGALVAAALTLAVPLGSGALAAEGQPHPPKQKWSFAGAFGTFDRAQLQRGFKVYREVCQACHSMNLVAFRNLAQRGGPEFSEAQVKALAAEYKIKDLDDKGESIERAGRPSDRFPSPFPNLLAAASANGGKAPPDFSVLAKARTYESGFPKFLFDALPFLTYQEQGPDYIHGMLNGYVDAPADMKVPEGTNYNTYFPGHFIAMPKPLSDGQLEYPKGPDGKSPVPETVDQYAKDVAAFLVWAAEPHMERRKFMGFVVLVWLAGFSVLLYLVKKKVWAGLGQGGSEATTRV
jgi:ubiquinol-cytochrome c reductase cytochrome c1 subunit